MIDIMDTGKIPPQAIDLEKAVLGALLLESEAFLDVVPILTADMFYKQAHQTIYSIIIDMANARKKVDLLTITQEMKDREVLEEVGGPVYITQLTSKVASAAHIEYHARIIRQKYMRRELIRLAHKVNQNSYDESNDIDDVYDWFQSEILRLFSPSENRIKAFSEAITELREKIKENFENQLEMTGIRTGLTRFDNFSGGLQPTDLYIIAGETSQGKTALAVTMIRNAVRNGEGKIGFFSLEMSALQLAARIAAQESGISGKQILMQKLDPFSFERVDESTSKISGYPIYFDESSTINIDSICNSIRRMKLKYDINIGVVDYIQLVSGPQGNGREEEIGAITRKLKNLAKELNIPIIALSQLRRSDNPKPTMNRLRASGQIEEAADVIILLWRPYTYGIEQIDTETNIGMVNSDGKAEIIIAKGRNIGTAAFLEGFDEEVGRFYDLEDYSTDLPLPEEFAQDSGGKNDTPF